METEEKLILGKFKKGDVVVSLANKLAYRKEGDLFEVLPHSSKYALYYLSDTNNGSPNNWRIATEEEKQAYEKGIKNIKDILPAIFKKGQYIVTLIDDGLCGKINYCSKQRKDSYQLEPEIDTNGYRTNKNGVFKAKDISFTKWRWATKEEGEEYERRKKPYDVTELNSYVGKWYKFFANSVINYGKVKSITSKLLMCEPWIYMGYVASGGWDTKLITMVEEVDVSIPEIQEHLKEGHPDKIHPEFKCIPGEIYRVDWTKGDEDPSTIIFKPLTNEGHKGQVYFLNTTYNKFHKNNGVCTAPKLSLKFSKASLEEKQWLERCIKVNKWVPMKQEKLIKGEIYKCKGTRGSIFMFDHGNSASHYIGDSLASYAKGGGNFHEDPEDYQLANVEERAWLQACIKVDRFITKEEALKKEYKYHVVECKTQEEWDFVRQNVPGCTLSSKVFKAYEKIGITFRKEEKEGRIGTYCNIAWFEKNNSKIYSFDEWKKEMNITDYSGKISYASVSSLGLSVEKIPSITTYMVDYSKFDKCAIYTKPGIEHQEPIIIKKINKQKSILVL